MPARNVTKSNASLDSLKLSGKGFVSFSDVFSVDASASFIVSGMVGAPVDLVVYDAGRTRLVKTVIDHTMPLRLRQVEALKPRLRPARRVMLLAHHDGLALRADGHLSRVDAGDESVFLEINQVHWEVLERRRHVRVPVKADVSLRMVVEGEEQPVVSQLNGTTVDLSVSGAFVVGTNLPAENSLIEFSIDLDGHHVRTLAVVAHNTTGRQGVGLHFVEYIDNARFLLHGFLTKAA